VLDDIRQRLARDEVRRGFHLWRKACIEYLERDRERTSTRERVERCREALLGEDRRVHAPRELTELVNGRLELVDRGREQAVDLGIGVFAGPALGNAELEGQRNQPLLGAVMQIALDPAPLVVRRRDDTPARLLHLLKLRPHLRLEAGILEREPGGGTGRPNELGLVEQRRVMDEYRDRLTVLVEFGDRSPSTLGELDRPTGRVRELTPLR